MSDLYSVIPGLQPTAQELLEGELLCKQILEAKFPELELREGTGLRDLVLRPSALLFALVKKATDYYFTQNTITGVDDTTPSEVVDAILSNWFLNRNIGTRSVINVRLYFARKKNVSISSDNYFSTDNTYKFFPQESISYAAESLAYDSYSNEYYIDTDLTAESEGLQYNLSSGSLLYFANFDPYFLRAEINYLKTESINSETNSEFISRSKTAISTRNLINSPSIDARLRDAFNYITRLVPIGMGDPEMVRDQIKAIFEPETPRTPDSVVRAMNIVTVEMPSHGYFTGQKLEMANAFPTDYNGQYSITKVDNGTFTYEVSTTPGSVVQVPDITAVNAPIYIHNGGMVDIYCSDKLATSTIQLTLDDFGRATLTGPIYNVKRSAISAGDSDDSLASIVTKIVSEVDIVGTTATVITTVPHTFVLSDKVVITGATQKQELISLSSTGITASAMLYDHGYQVGNMVTISEATPEGYNGTFEIVSVTENYFQYTLKGPISTSATGRFYSDVNLINGIKTLTAVTDNTFTFNIPQASTVHVYGDVNASVPVNYTIIHDNTYTKPFEYISSSGTEVTVDSYRHGYTHGRYITISNCGVDAYNGTWFIKTIVNDSRFLFDLPTSVIDSSAQGLLTSTIPWKDYGFSQKQSMTIDFGGQHANQTASFEIDYFQNLDSIQTYLDSPINRVVCADYLAKGFNFYQLNVEVTSYNEVMPDVSLVDTIIRSYLSGLVAGETFIMSDMVSKLRLNGVINIQTPPKVTYKKYTRDLSPVETGTIKDILDPNDRTSVFLLDNVLTFTQNITVNNTAFTL